jgi:cold-inducible RNA-binding protein
MNIYVGNLSNHTSEDELRQALASFGEVSKVNIISDRYTGESRGFAFVEMPNQAEGQAAIDGLNGTDLGGRTLSVNVARPRQDTGGGGGGSRGPRRPSGGGGGGGRGRW